MAALLEDRKLIVRSHLPATVGGGSLVLVRADVCAVAFRVLRCIEFMCAKQATGAFVW
jgi:hypothetical protein